MTKTLQRSNQRTLALSFGIATVLATSVVGSAMAQQKWKAASGPLMTPWSQQVSPTNALPEYPRPQMTRARWQNLNGLWSYAFSGADETAAPATFAGRILVPYPLESALSGVGHASIPDQRLWYRRSFSIPAAWRGQRVLLHFGAVNWDASVMVNGHNVGAHRGGYDGFTFDITSRLKPGANQLMVSASNPIKADVADAQVIGKQRLKPGGIFYTGATGIWQTVWLEPVPVAHIASLKMTPDIDAKTLTLLVQSADAPNYQVRVEAFDGKRRIARINADANTQFKIPVAAPHLWSPTDPHLYTLKVWLYKGKKNVDSVSSYFAMRKISLDKDAQGRNRIFLNNAFLFQVGALDQGYWPDGIYTAPTDAALRYDIEIAKKLGWNLLRKHAKVEPARWYYHADKLGMLVWQDMPQAFGDLNDAAKAQWDSEWREIMAENHNSPSIVVWTTFNEGMGQHDTERVVAYTKFLDPSRLVNNASGWVDKKVGDMHDTHAYPGPWSNEPEANRAAVNGEFGGITMDAGHRWVNNAAVMGYGATLKSSWLATKRYQNLMKTAYRLRDERGTSAVVYTQLTDVEQEINGLLSYDRAVMKLDLPIVAAANKGVFLPLPPNPNPELVPTADEEPIDWRYSFEKPADNWTQPTFDDAAWRVGQAPFGHDFGGARTDWATSDIWMRRAFTLPAIIPAKLNFSIRHDEEAEIYLNGVLAASVTGYKGDYTPLEMNAAGRGALHAGQNTIAVHVHQTIGGQGIDVGIVAAR